MRKLPNVDFHTDAHSSDSAGTGVARAKESLVTESTNIGEKFKDSVCNDCGHCESPMRSVHEAKIRELQSRIDDLLAGKPKISAAPTEENSRLFAPFNPSDAARADIIAALCEKKAEKLGGLIGLEEAVNHLYEVVGRFPAGLVEHATKLFLTHYPPAREIFYMRSLEERQPGMVRPSQSQN